MSTSALNANAATAHWRLRFVEDMGGQVLVHGTPRAVMRVLGWMIVCDPPEQTAGRMQTELSLSAGSVSTSLRTLCEVGIVEKVARPGDRRIYYRLSSPGWERVLESRFRVFTELRRVADRALHAAGDEADDRLHEMRDTYALMEEGTRELLRQSLERNAGTPSGTTPLHRPR
jgi:DNA-binding transcriptional regulator GbsR (MarR family)